MNYRTALLSSAAVVALSSNAWAAQGDTYLSLFGGYSTLGDTDVVQTYSNKQTNYITAFQRRSFLAYQYTTVYIKTTSGVSKAKLPEGYVVVGTQQGTYKLTESRQFSGDVGTSGWVVGAALGVELLGGLRGEAEMAFRRFDFDDAATLDFSNLYRRRVRYDGYYSYKIGIQTGTRYDTFTGVKETGTFLTSIPKVNFTDTHYVKNAGASVEGELTSFSFMANLWYDFPLGDSGFTPFVGGGIGVANLTMSHNFRANNAIPQYRFNNLGTTTYTTKATVSSVVVTNTITNTTLTTSTTMVTPTTHFKNDDAVFAYQFGAGLGYEFENGLRLSAQYRYFATTEGDFGSLSESVETSDVLFSISFPFGGGGR